MPPAVETKSVSKLKNVYHLLTDYAVDHEGHFPATYNMQFLDDCVSAGYITENEIEDYRADNAGDGTTGYCLIPNRTQTMRGSWVLAITSKPVINNKFTVVTISGKTECMTEDEALDKIIATLENRSWRPRGYED